MATVFAAVQRQKPKTAQGRMIVEQRKPRSIGQCVFTRGLDATNFELPDDHRSKAGVAEFLEPAEPYKKEECRFIGLTVDPVTHQQQSFAAAVAGVATMSATKETRASDVDYAGQALSTSRFSPETSTHVVDVHLCHPLPMKV